MLSALIPSIHSYPAIHLVAKPVDQRYVQPSPLVLRPTPLKYQTPVTDRDRPVSRNFFFSSLLTLWTIPPSPFSEDDRRFMDVLPIQSVWIESLRGNGQ